MYHSVLYSVRLVCSIESLQGVSMTHHYIKTGSPKAQSAPRNTAGHCIQLLKSPNRTFDMPQPILTRALAPQEKCPSHRKRQHEALGSRRRNEAAVLLRHRIVPRIGYQLRRDLARLRELVELGRHGGEDGRRPARRTENDLEAPARWDDEGGCLIVKCCTTVSILRGPPNLSCHPPKLYASGQTLFAS